MIIKLYLFKQIKNLVPTGLLITEMEAKEEQICNELPKKVLIEEIVTETSEINENELESNLSSDQN